jgi:hypothetical protein
MIFVILQIAGFHRLKGFRDYTDCRITQIKGVRD